MTLRGKRKAFNNDPQAQISAISEAFYGKVPVKPVPRRYPKAAWQEGEAYHVIKLRKGVLYHSTYKSEPEGISILMRDAFTASGNLALDYHRKISIPDLQAALAGPIPVPTLAEAQIGIIYWAQNCEPGRDSSAPIYEYCVVSPEGIRTGTNEGKPRPVKGYKGPLISVLNISQCKQLLRMGFQLDIRGGELKEALNKVVKVPKILAV